MRKCKLKLLLSWGMVFIWVLTFTPGISQSWDLSKINNRSIHTKTIGVRDGLPSSETYNVFQDRQGYIWVSTDRGLAKYNGSSMEVFDVSNGLPENVVFEVFQDSEGWIWVETMNNHVAYIKEGKITQLDSSGTQLKLSFFPVYFYNIAEDEDRNIWIGFNKKEKHFTKFNKRLKKLTAVPFKNKHAGVEIRTFKNGNFVYSKSGPMDDNMENYGYISFDLSSVDTSILITGKQAPVKNNFFPSRIEKVSDSLMAFSVNTGVLFVQANREGYSSTYLDFKATISCVVADESNNIWVGTVSDGVYKLSANSNNIDHFLPDQSVTGVCFDKEGGTWFSTLENGVKYCANLQIDVPIRLLDEKDGKIRALTKCGSSIFVGTQKGKWYEFLGENSYKAHQEKFNIFHMMCLDEHNYIKVNLTTRREHWYNKKLGKKIYCDSLINSNFGYTNDLVRVHWLGNRFVVKERKTGVWHPIQKLQSRIQCAYYFNEKLYIGTSEALYEYRVEKGLLKKVSQQKIDILCLQGVDKKMFIATKGQGLLALDGNDIRMVANFGVCNDFTLGLNELFIATNKGVVAYHLLSETYEIINESHGLPSNEIRHIAYKDNYIWVASPKSVSVIPNNQFWLTNFKPNVWFSEIRINETQLYEGQILNQNQNNISIALSSDNYSATKRKFEYKFESDSTWSRLEGSSIHFYNLPPDNYTLLVKAVGTNGNKSKNPAVVRFTIVAPWYAQKWFYVLVALSCGLLLYLGFRWRSNVAIKKVEIEEKYKRRLALLELKALQSQMNPHFLFNSINSIQYYLVTSKKEEGKNYLSKFSKLVRMVLNNSRRDFISIKDELESLKLYLEIEQMRFENEFTFDIQVMEGIDENFDKIPGMLIQPFVENAVWHGITGKKEGKGEIIIKFTVNTEGFQIQVIDNGVGREQSLALQQKRITQKKSIGLTLVSERIQLINTFRKTKISYLILDLKDNKNNPLGTKVVINIPFA